MVSKGALFLFFTSGKQLSSHVMVPSFYFPTNPLMAIHRIPCLAFVGSGELEVYIFFALSITPAPYLSTYSSTSRTRPPHS